MLHTVLVLLGLVALALSVKREIRNMSSNVGAGLAALQQVDSSLADAVTANTAATTANTAASQAIIKDLQDLQTQLASNEDPAVQAIATDMAAKLDALKANTVAVQASTDALSAAVAPPAPAPTPDPGPTPDPNPTPNQVAPAEESKPLKSGEVHFH